VADRFPCGLMVSELESRKLTFANDYVASMLGYTSEEMMSASLETILTKASMIFMDSYVYPSLLDDGEHSELQLTLMGKNGDRFPVLANIRANEQGYLHWALFSAVERDKMYQELIAARDQLQLQAEKLKAIASTDSLTGLLNRRAAQERFERLYQQSNRAPTPLSLLLIDIDHFKQINDRYGHLEGDRIIVGVADVIQSTLRSVDLGVRWGGEEFLIVLYATDVEGAVGFSRRIHDALTQVKLEGFAVRVSIGVAQVNLNLESVSEALDKAVAAADQALYQAKDSGRNRTEFARF